MIRRSGNFGFVDNGNGDLYTFNMNARRTDWAPTDYTISADRYGRGLDYVMVNGVKVIPFGVDNDLPGYVSRILEKFYAGEGIMGKKAGLQWGEGPRLYRDAVDDANNMFYRRWTIDERITDDLKRADYLTQMHRCLVDLVHLEGFWVKFICSRGRRVGSGKIVRVEHVPANKVRFVYPGAEDAAPTHAVVGNFPYPDRRYQYVYPLFDPENPTRHAVSLAYFNIYSYCHDHYSVPRFVGAFDWLKLAGSLATLLAIYNENASAISMHIESPQSYWDRAEERIKEICEKTGKTYRAEMLEEFKDEAMEKFAASMTGRQNAGKFMHTSQFWNAEANNFEGWKITPIDKKVKEYIEAQCAIIEKAEAASTTGFGIDPAMSNLVSKSAFDSGSQKLYAYKVYIATETAVPDMTLCRPWQIMIDANNPGTKIKIGLYRNVTEAEKDVSPEARMKENV